MSAPAAPTAKPAASRPAELAAWLVAAPAIFGFLTTNGVGDVAAALVAAVLGFVPLAVSTLKDAGREADDPGDHVVEQLPAQLAPEAIDHGHEQHGIDHTAERDAAGG